MKAILFALLAGLCWGIGEVATKQVLASKQVGPFAALAVRMFGACLLAAGAYLVAVVALKSEPTRWWTAPTPVLLKLLLGTTLAAGFGGVCFFYVALKFGDISLVKPIAFVLAPVTAALIGWLLMGEPMNTRKGLGIALGLAAIVLIASGGHAPAKPGTPPASDETKP